MAKKKTPDNASWLRPLPEDFAKDTMSSKRRMVLSSITFVVLAGFSLLIWMSYTSEGDEMGPIPVVRADNSVIKKKPDEPGGKEIPFQDKEVFARVDNLPTEEENIIAASAEIPLKRPVAEQVEEVEEDVEQITAELAEKAEAIEPAAAPPPPPPAVTRAATTGDFMIQIGAFAQKSKAEALWNDTKSKNNNVMANLEPIYMRVDLGEKGVLYRVRGGMIDGRGAADKICSALKSKNQGCMVVTK